MSENQPQKQTLNLQTISQNFLAGLQRHFDMLAFNFASRTENNSDAYTQTVQAPKLMPFPQAHMNYEQVEAFSQDLLQRNFLNDMLQMSVACMDNCYLLCTLMSHQKELKTNADEVNPKIQQEQQSFAQKPLHEKFELYEEKFGYMTEYEDTLISLGMCLQCLAQKQGILSETEAENGVLQIEIKRLPEAPDQSLPAEQQLATINKEVKVGERISFDQTEMQSIIITITAFFHDLFRFIDGYAKTLKAAEETE